MPTVNLSPIFNGWQGFTAAGLPLSGGLLHTYLAGTSTPSATYTSVSGAVANANPIVLDASGRPPNEIWLIQGQAYQFVLTDALGLNPLSYDNISGTGDSTSVFASLATSAGATLVGWIQAGVGAILRTVSSKLRDAVSPEDFGAVADDTTDCLAAFQACYTYCVSVGKAMAPVGGTYKLSGAWTISDSNFRCIPKGAVTLHFTNAGRALVIDGGAVTGNIYDVVFGGDQPIRIKGNAATTDIVFSRAAHHSMINVDCKDGITACRINFAVASTFKVECSVNTGAFVLTPTSGIVLDLRGAGEFVADCEIVPIIEGVSGTGIVGTNASFNTIRGGTSEGNAKGLTWGANCYLNQVVGTDFEANTTSDLEDVGNNNQGFGIRCGSGSGNVILTGNGANFHGGYLRQAATTGSTLTAYYGVDFSDNGGLGISGTGTIAARVGCTRSNTSNVVTGKYADLVGESGATWTPGYSSAGGGTQGATTTAVGTSNTVGKQVFVQGILSIAKGSLGAGSVSITGLPIQSRNTANDFQYISAGEWDSVTLGAGYTHLALRIAPNATSATLIKSGTAVVSAVVNVADFPDPMGIRFSGAYESI